MLPSRWRSSVVCSCPLTSRGRGASDPFRGRPVEGGAIPPREVGSGFIRALKELQRQRIRRGCRPHRLVRQNEVVQLSTIVGGRRPLKRVRARSNAPQKKCTGLVFPRNLPWNRFRSLSACTSTRKNRLA